MSCNVFNNFIIGGTDSTDPSNYCHGIYIVNSDINVINNTISGNGTPGGSNWTSAIYAEDTDSYLVNNIIIGGEGAFKYGIWLGDSTLIVSDMVIYNNTFYNEKCINGYFINPPTSTFWYTITEIESNYNPGNLPSGNLDFDEIPSADVLFIDSSDPSYDYSIDTGSPDISSIVDNGYPLGNLSIFSTGVPNDAKLDIDGTDRDLSTIDRGAHEFNP